MKHTDGRAIIRTTREIPWLRIAIEMVVIVASILLAFGIDAWWSRGQEQRNLAAYGELLRIQMEANRGYLEEQVEGAERAVASLGVAVRTISPNPELISSDSLWSLLRSGWTMGDRQVETSALERLLSLETFEPAEHQTLYRQMVEFRSQAGLLSRNVERFVDAKERTAD